MFDDLIPERPDDESVLDMLTVDRPLEVCPVCGGLLSSGHLEAADAGWVDAACRGCGVVLAA